MSPLLELVRRARETGDARTLAHAIPYSSFLGFEVETRDGELIGRLAYRDHLIGNPVLPALHGGTIGALLESTAILSVLLRVETLHVPKTVSLTVDFLRSGRPVDTWASAEITKLGRRIASVRTLAWQEARERPIAAANAHFLLLPAEEEDPG